MSQSLEGHTVKRYDGEMHTLHMLVLEMAGVVMNQAEISLQALMDQDLSTAKSVMEREHDVDALELRLDQEVVSVIARRGPVALDLRAIMAFSKSVTDLERIGDEAARIAHLAINMYDNDSSDPSVHLLRDIQTMGRISMGLLREAVALVDTLEVQRARRLIRDHGELDVEFQSALRRLSTFILEDARNVGHTVSVVLILKALERIGDHARNLAEYVIFLVEGDDVRHKTAAARLRAKKNSGLPPSHV